MALGLIAPLAAQDVTPQLPTPMLPPRAHVTFTVQGKAEQECPIEVAEASVKVRLAGALAETTVTLVFHNPNGRAMEGELSYPLPPDATVQGYALDVNGKMVDGVPVPKQKARVAFETEQRKGVDPGLAEWSGGNRFKTRISPIPAHGQRTITLRYTTMVQQNDKGASYRLPLDFEKVGSFKLRIEALAAQQPQVQAGGLGNLSFAPWQNHFVLEREWKELALKEDLVIDLPQGMAEAPAVEKHGDSFYLAKLITPPKGEATGLPKPGYIDLIWDCSASMAEVDKAPIFEALRLYFEQNPDCVVRLTSFGNEVRPAPEWHDHAKLLEALKSKHYDGATIELPLELAQEQALCLLVTDGKVNFADKLETAQPGKGNIYAFVSSSKVDKSALRRWGAIPIDLLSQTPQQALANIPAWQLAGVELNGKPWEGALTNAPSGVVEGSLLLTGSLPAGKHEVTVILRSAKGEERVSFSVDTEGAAEGRMNRSLFAQNKLATLLLEPETPERAEKLRWLGEEFGIVTPGTSLLVLENLEQYLTHEVRPPACCPELRASYDARIAERAEANARSRENSLAVQKAIAMSARKDLLTWYERDGSKPQPGMTRPQPRPAEPARPVEPIRPIPLARETDENAEVNRLLQLAYDYYELGKYDEAYAEFNRVIAIDSYHQAARRGQEAVSRARSAYYRRAHDSYRARALAEVDAEWDEAEEDEGEPAPAPAPVVVATGAAPVSMAATTIADADMEDDDMEDDFDSGTTVELASRASNSVAPTVVVGSVSQGVLVAEGAADIVEEEEGEPAASPQAAIRVQGWSSDAPYLAVLRAAQDPVAAYYEQRRQYAASPGFFLDCADFFEQKGERNMAVRVLSNLLEMDWENRSLMRAAAYKLRYMGETEKAILLFRKVMELFPEEPQSYRDLALAYADAGRWQEAADTLRLVLERPMDGRFYGMEQIAANELAHIAARAQQAGKPVKLDGVDAVYLKPIETDLRLVINWDTDLSDMDLWVIDPKGERCFYGHNRTRTGGRISRDVTDGYGPEEFLIRKALPGSYKVQAHYYGSRSQKMLAPVTLYAELYTDYGRPTEKRQTLLFRLDGRDQVVHIADITHTADPAAPTTRDYQVRAVDTWESIALRELGDVARAQEIRNLNPESTLQTGVIIRIPKN